MIQERAVATRCDLGGVSAAPPIVVKIGGSTLESARAGLNEIAQLARAGWQPVVVHGGGPAINHMLAKLGVAPRFVAGRRVTDEATLEVVRAVLIGQVNSDLVRLLTHLGAPAVGLSGMDGGLARARRAAPELGLVGLVERVDRAPLVALRDAGYIPVVAPLCLGPDDECLNVNADDVATALARELGATALIFQSNVPGVLDGAGQILPRLTARQARDLIADGTIAGGMVPKIQGCLAALATVRSVHIVDGALPHGLCHALAHDDHPGTCIVPD